MISSRANPLLRYVRALHRRRTRHVERAFIVEGERAIQDALVAGAMPAHILLSHDWQPHIANLQEQLERVPPHLVHHVDSALMPQLADTVTPSGILAVFPFPNPKEPPGTPLVVIADGLGDPGNLGTLIRTAAAAGATRVILAGQTVDAFNPKVVRAGMGAHFHIPIQVLHGENDLSSIRQIPFRILAESGKHPPPEAIKWTGPTLLIIGGEAAGAGAISQELATHRVSIPLAAGVESLNAAVAAAVLLFEASRQRRSLDDLATMAGSAERPIDK